MKKQKFEAELISGHKGDALIVPFDPEETWGISPKPVTTRLFGKRPGHLVSGTLNGHPFGGWIGHRWGRFFILVDEDLQRAAKVAVGDTVAVEVAPMSGPQRGSLP